MQHSDIYISFNRSHSFVNKGVSMWVSFIKGCVETVLHLLFFLFLKSECDSENERTHKERAYASLPNVKSTV